MRFVINKFSKFVNKAELLLWISNIPHLDEWMRHIQTRAYPPPIHTHIHTYTHTYTHTQSHTHIHARAHIHKQGVTLYILVSGISSESAVYHHSDVFPDGSTAQFHVTNFVNWCVAWRDHLIRSNTLNLFFTNFWCSHELDILKERSVAWDRNWKNGW